MQVVFPIAEAALQTVHHCDTKQEGDWTVYTCKRCPGYERKIHAATGQVIVKGPGALSVEHVGGGRRKRG